MMYYFFIGSVAGTVHYFLIKKKNRKVSEWFLETLLGAIVCPFTVYLVLKKLEG